ncbi:erythroid membrane-associated protein-like isoform X2 [Lissotriton helveticus]
MMALMCLPRLLPLLLLCLYHQTSVSGAAVQSVEAVGPSQSICAIVGGKTIFSCHLNPPISAEELEVSWATENQTYLVHSYDKGTEYDKPDEQYKGRTKLIKKGIAHGVVALSLTNLTRSDTGQYMCTFRSTTRDIDTFAEFELQVAGASACDLEKERDNLLKEKETLQKEKDTLQMEKDTLQKHKVMGDLINAIDNHQNKKEKGDLIKARDQLKKEKVTVTLDPDTAHPWLLLSEGQRRMIRTDTAQPVPDTPKRFTYYHCVLGSEGFTSGRHYWEVQLLQEGYGWEVGVAAESVNRKGPFIKSPSQGVWAIRRWDGEWSYKALTYDETSLWLREKPQKLGVYLDYEGGRISLYNADSMELLYTFPQALFTERLFPFFWIDEGTEMRLV